MRSELKKLKYRLSRLTETPKITCTLCQEKIYEFEPLDKHYLEMTAKYGFPYALEDAETLNVTAYNCPLCGGSDRDRLYALFFNKSIEPDKTYNLLDIAPAKALAAFIKKKKNIAYRSADLYMPEVDDKVDLTDMHIYKDNTFDIFVCSHVLEHVPDDKKAMKELYRVLKPGGWGIAMVPIFKSATEIKEDPTVTDESERWRRFGQDDHIRLYSKAGFKERLQEAGFEVKEFTTKDFKKDAFSANGIDPGSVLYIVNK
ncbi:methyltransferase domain-containing protein [Pontibacter qinzhouensis]|uniref:Methyltransferase domain-containing protein n=1 Tax=Pontibacter qinzhouensis TaxID=2603253 RepID=A0A5C8KBI1_9BACT|nr:class I SAM-dependent methyltransferase [Pontibacter qinzhouensis]TXK49868.1 methyltransferase domain-containing protein [Pontibacter qinzhouensis]